VIAAVVYFAAINPTVGGAIVAGVFLTLNTWLTERRWHHVDRRLNERRNVIVKGTPDDPKTVIVTQEERRALSDPLAAPASENRKLRERRRRERRSDAL
jgi:hypothetical protein